MKIIIIVNSFPKLSETFIFNKVLGLLEAGFDVTVLAHQISNDKKFYKDRDVFNKMNIIYSGLLKSEWFRLLLNPISLIRSFILSYNSENYLKSNLRNSLLLFPFIKNKYDIVHFEYSGLAIQYLDIIEKIKSKKIISCRGAAEQISPLVINNRKEELSRLFKIVDKVHCVSNDMAELLEKYGLKKEKYFINYPSIDISKFNTEGKKNHSKDKIIIISVGRLHWKKGLNYGILSINELVKKGYDITYHIIGDGPEKESLIYMINQLELTNQIKLLGRKSSDEVKLLLANSDIFFLPSLSEGISNSALEAMAMGIAVVSTDVGGMNEAIVDNNSGILVESMNYTKMSEGIIKLLESPTLRSKIANNGLKRIKDRFSLENQIEIFHKEYVKLYL